MSDTDMTDTDTTETDVTETDATDETNVTDDADHRRGVDETAGRGRSRRGRGG